MDHKITIGLPVYNRTDYFREAIESALNQSVKCPVLVIDNNSPHYEFKSIIDSYNNPLIKYVRTQETVPQDENFNNCFRYAETPFVTVLHDDDLLHYQFVEFCSDILERFGEKVKGICFRSDVSDRKWENINKHLELGDDIKIVKPAYHYFNTLVFPGILVKKDLALEIGGFRSNLLPIADVDFWYRYNTRGNYYMADLPLSYYRISPTQSTNQLVERMINNAYEYRIAIMKERKAYHFMNRLALEYTRVVNIDYFKKTYPSLEIEDKIIHKKRLEAASKLLRFKIITRIILKYIQLKSFTRA